MPFISVSFWPAFSGYSITPIGSDWDGFDGNQALWPGFGFWKNQFSAGPIASKCRVAEMADRLPRGIFGPTNSKLFGSHDTSLRS